MLQESVAHILLVEYELAFTDAAGGISSLALRPGFTVLSLVIFIDASTKGFWLPESLTFWFLLKGELFSQAFLSFKAIIILLILLDSLGSTLHLCSLVQRLNNNLMMFYVCRKNVIFC